MIKRQSGFIAYVMLAALVISAAGCGYGYVMMLQRDAARAEAKIHEANYLQAKEEIGRQLQTVQDMRDLNKKGQDQIYDLFNDLDGLHKENMNYQNEINELRQTEFSNALKEPFESGNAARDRINFQLRRFTGTDASRSSTDITTSDDTTDTEPTVDADTGGHNTDQG